MEKLYLNKEGMERFLSNLKNIFSLKSHSHTKSDISDLPKTIGTITGIKMNGASKGTSGVVDLGSVLTSGKQTTTSTADGGSNVYTFSDNSTITVKNGSKGTNGTNGTSSVWFTGTVVTGTSTTATAFTVSGSKAGDMYLNTSTYNVYKASASNSWVYVCNIKGAKGTDGTNATTTAVATTSANGLMSSTDKTNMNYLMSCTEIATCATPRNTLAKVATLSNFVLKPHSVVIVKFTDTTTTNPTSGNFTLNVNNTGAKTIAFTRNGAIGAMNYTTGGTFYNNLAHMFVYNGTYWICVTYNADNNTTYSNMTAATADVAGKAGLVPAPAAGKQGQYLRGDGTWATPTNTTYSVASATANGLMSSTDKKNLDLVNNPLATCSTGRATAAKVATLANYTLTIGKPIAVKFTDTAGTANPTSGNLTLNVNGTGAKNIGYFRNGSKAALTYANGAYFYNNATHLFTYDGSYWLCLDWNADNNTTYSNFVKSGSGAKAGLVPAPSTTAGTTKYLREDGTWVVPPNTTYSKLSQFTNDKHYICEELSSSEPTDQSVGDYWVTDY